MAPLKLPAHVERTMQEMKELLASADADSSDYLRWAHEITKDSAATISAAFSTQCVVDPTGAIVAHSNREIQISKDKNTSW
jgi:hypothetical protein